MFKLNPGQGESLCADEFMWILLKKAQILVDLMVNLMMVVGTRNAWLLVIRDRLFSLKGLYSWALFLLLINFFYFLFWSREDIFPLKNIIWLYFHAVPLWFTLKYCYWCLLVRLLPTLYWATVAFSFLWCCRGHKPGSHLIRLLTSSCRPGLCCRY